MVIQLLISTGDPVRGEGRIPSPISPGEERETSCLDEERLKRRSDATVGMEDARAFPHSPILLTDKVTPHLQLFVVTTSIYLTLVSSPGNQMSEGACVWESKKTNPQFWPALTPSPDVIGHSRKKTLSTPWSRVRPMPCECQVDQCVITQRPVGGRFTGF